MRAFIAITIGVLAEAALIALLAAGGIGPCGPASPVGALVLILHVPGLSLASAVHLKEPLSLVVVGAALLFGITTGDEMLAFYENGHGPIAQCPLWLQVVVYLIGADVWMYWVHRAFHRPAIWKYHAIHHSSTDLDWISATRFHPINLALGSVMADVVLLLAGRFLQRRAQP